MKVFTAVFSNLSAVFGFYSAKLASAECRKQRNSAGKRTAQ
jgi:hypothetical protein